MNITNVDILKVTRLIFLFFLKNNKLSISKNKANSMLNYLNSSDHKMVRENLRNSFTHSVERTSSYIFHKKVNDKVQPQMDYLFPTHPFKNLNFVIMDVLKVIEFINEIVSEMYVYRNNYLILLEITTTMPCGIEIKDPEKWNLYKLKEYYEKIIITCKNPCDKAHKYNGTCVCKPIKVGYQRIHSIKGQTSGTLIPTMTFEEMKAVFGEN